MVDYNWLTERLATGGAITTVQDLEVLWAAGVRTIVSCAFELDDAPLIAQSGKPFEYLHAGVADDGQPKQLRWFKSILEFVLPKFAGPKGRVYIHCGAGINRGPSGAYAVLRALGLSATDAMNLIRARRPQAQVAYASSLEREFANLGY